MIRTTAPSLDLDRVRDYIEGCQTTDGGYFFAKVPPAGAADTYYATSTLRLLGAAPRNSVAVTDWLERVAGNISTHSRTIFHLVETGRLLGLDRRVLVEWAAPIYQWQNREGGFGALNVTNVETASELEATHCAVKTLADLRMELDRRKVVAFVRARQNPDGGFGSGERSTIASTWFAIGALAVLGTQPADGRAVVRWLAEAERAKHSAGTMYMEDNFWLSASAQALGVELTEPNRAIAMVLASQRPSGGFARSVMGIATLEYTYYAIAILNRLGALQ
jgi:hypothetical protein